MSAPASRPLRVAVLDHTADLGGAELALARLLDALPGVECEVRVVLFSDGPLVERLRSAGHDVEVIPLGALATASRLEAGRSPVSLLRTAAAAIPFVWRLGRHLRATNSDVIHATSLKAGLIGVPVSWIARRPLVWHVHDRISPDYLPLPAVALVRALARRAARRVIANSAATAATLPGVRQIVVAYPGVLPEQVAPDTGERRSVSPPVVGILGRISDTKGQLEFVRAAAQVLVARPDAQFRVVGSAMFGHEAYEQQVRAEAVALGLGNRVTFTGFAVDPAAELDQMSVCVHASGTPEPFGQVIVEAMVRGVPVVATRGGGVTEILEPGDGSATVGWLVPPHDVDALAAAIVEVLADPAAADERATRAWRYAVERFSIRETAAVVTDVWRSAAGAGR